MACVSVVDPQASDLPEYPFVAFKTDTVGTVTVKLTFVAPDQAPKVKVLDAPNDSSFEASVLRHLKQLRVPCAQAQDLPFVLVRSYEFKPDKRTAIAEFSDPERAKAQAQLLSCLQHQSGDKKPEFPLRAARRGVQGAVMVDYRFSSGDQAASYEVMAPQGAEVLKDVIQDWFAGMRMPCYAGEPYHGRVMYRFTFDGEAYGFKPDMTFKQLLASTSKAQLATLPTSTVDMGCPFDVRWSYTMPYRPNDVRQLNDRDERRKPMLDWLADLVLQLPKKSEWTAFGDATTFQVPCYQFK